MPFAGGLDVEGGYGFVPFGHAEYGHAASVIEPRFFSSVPDDGAVGISVYQTVIRFRIYGFSSRVQSDGFRVEISEDGGGEYADAYVSGGFVMPYDGSLSLVDAHRGESHVLLVVIEKDDLWRDDEQIVVRVTSQDEYGQETTKEAPVVWGS